MGCTQKKYTSWNEILIYDEYKDEGEDNTHSQIHVDKYNMGNG